LIARVNLFVGSAINPLCITSGRIPVHRTFIVFIVFLLLFVDRNRKLPGQPLAPVS
jgi:hypothetical protein